MCCACLWVSRDQDANFQNWGQAKTSTFKTEAMAKAVKICLEAASRRGTVSRHHITACILHHSKKPANWSSAKRTYVVVESLAAACECNREGSFPHLRHQSPHCTTYQHHHHRQNHHHWKAGRWHPDADKWTSHSSKHKLDCRPIAATATMDERSAPNNTTTCA